MIHFVEGTNFASQVACTLANKEHDDPFCRMCHFVEPAKTQHNEATKILETSHTTSTKLQTAETSRTSTTKWIKRQLQHYITDHS